MTTTEALLEAIRAELERRKPEIDGDDALRGVSIIVTLNPRNRRPVRVIYRTESQRDLQAIR